MPKQTPKQIHNEYNVFGDNLKININHQYMKAVDAWKFVGFRCRLCDSSFKFVSSMTKHEKTCKVLNKLKDDNNANTETDS